MKTLIKKVTHHRSGRYKADVLIEGERVSVIGAKLEMEGDKVIDAAGSSLFRRHRSSRTGSFLLAGNQSFRHFRTGTIAAATAAYPILDFAVAVQRRVAKRGN